MVSFFADCVEAVSLAQTTVDADDIEKTHYVGPWWVGETDCTDTIDIDILAESGGDEEDIYLWLTNTVDQAGTISSFYGICKCY